MFESAIRQCFLSSYNQFVFVFLAQTNVVINQHSCGGNHDLVGFLLDVTFIGKPIYDVLENLIIFRSLTKEMVKIKTLFLCVLFIISFFFRLKLNWNPLRRIF